MGEERKEKGETVDIMEGLTDEQQKLLRDAINKAGWKVFADVLSRLKWALGIASVLFTAFGLVSIEGLKSEIAESAAKRIGESDAVRREVAEKAEKQLAPVNDVLKHAKDLDDQVQAQTAKLAAGIDGDLTRIQGMLQQLTADVAKLQKQQAQTSAPASPAAATLPADKPGNARPPG
jgi:hypothetical protein